MEASGTVWANLEAEVTLGDIGSQESENVPGLNPNSPLK